jgi:hypothetical protein
MRKIFITPAMLLCLSQAGVQAHAQAPLAAPPLTLQGKFQRYFRQTYSVPSVLFPAAFAGLDQATYSPEEWPQNGGGYLKRFATQRGQFQLAEFCAFGVGAALHEDPRFFPSNMHGMWRRSRYVLVHTLMARTDRGTEEPAFGIYAGALGGAFIPATWLPRSDNSMGDSLRRSAALLGMNLGINMGIEFGRDDRRFFQEKILHRFQRHCEEPCKANSSDK